ncbi:lantibiotic modifying enzyme [Streptococcus pneumoniae]|nr:lantibiotic modifying enzyme [Streptococcus pneumoniae]
MAIINFYIDYMKEMDTSMELESLLCSVVMNKSKEGEYRIVQTSNFPDFSLYTGVTGIAYTFLRYIALIDFGLIQNICNNVSQQKSVFVPYYLEKSTKFKLRG